MTGLRVDAADGSDHLRVISEPNRTLPAAPVPCTKIRTAHQPNQSARQAARRAAHFSLIPPQAASHWAAPSARAVIETRVTAMRLLR